MSTSLQSALPFKSAEEAAKRQKIKRGVVIVSIILAIIGGGIGIWWATKSDTSDAPTSTPTPTPTPTPSRPTAPPGAPRYFFLGDSVTSYGADVNGWTDLLVQKHGNIVNITNSGVSGTNSNTTIVTVIPDLTADLSSTPSPVLIAVWLGTNDATLIGSAYGEKHLPVEDYKANLFTILKTFREIAPKAKLVLFTPLVVDDAARLSRLKAQGRIFDPIDRSNEQAGIYAEATREVVSQSAGMNILDVSLFDIYKYFMDKYPLDTDRSAILDDGLHLSGKGHRETAEQLEKHILTLMPNAFTPAP